MRISTKTVATPALALTMAIAIGLAAAPPPARAAEDGMRRLVSVNGVGEVVARPDIAHVTAGVVTEADDAAAAVAENSRAVTALFAALKADGIADRDMQTASFGVSPKYDRPPRGETSRIVGYRVANAVIVRIRDLDRLGALLDRMVKAGANQLDGIRFGVDKEDNLLDEARRKAIADARSKAELYAREAGATLGRVIVIREAGASMPQPRAMRAMANADLAVAVPVAKGEQTLSVRVAVTYELK